MEKLPLSFADFADKIIVWVKFNSLPNDIGLIVEFKQNGLKAFEFYYNYEDLMNFAKWSTDRVVWNEFYKTV